MANPEHLAVLKQGVEVWNEWREAQEEAKVEVRLNLLEADLRAMDLTGANLSGAQLCKANLIRVNLSNADLSGANLMCADLTGGKLIDADLSGANLRESRLGSAHLNYAYLRGADLTNADLSQVDFAGAHLIDARLIGTTLIGTNFKGQWLRNTDFSGALLGATVFAATNLREARGLASVGHKGPSTIGVDTIYLSEGHIPEVFLRGCGVPDDLITYMPSLVGNPIEYYSCFISYSTKNEDFALRLHAQLRAAGLRVWYAPHDMKGGQTLEEQIDRAIQTHDRLLLLLSGESMDSGWVQTEIAKALRREVNEKRRVLFPIRLVSFETLQEWTCFDPDTKKDMASALRAYFIPDFSRWKDHDSFQAAFAKLCNDLRTERTPSP